MPDGKQALFNYTRKDGKYRKEYDYMRGLGRGISTFRTTTFYQDDLWAVNGKMDQTPNSLYIYSFLNKRFGYMESSLKKTEYDGCVIYPSEYFSPINYNTMRCNITDNTYAIHYYNGTWKGKKERTKGKLLAIITRIVGEDGREKLKRLLKR